MDKKLSEAQEIQLLTDVLLASLNEVLTGKRIRLKSTTDQYTDLKAGSEGTITSIDDAGTVHVKWDSGSTLGLVPDEDFWEIIS